MDFDTCVLEENPECRYVQDSDVEPVDCVECGGHFSQMAQFCGHDPVGRFLFWREILIS